MTYQTPARNRLQLLDLMVMVNYLPKTREYMGKSPQTTPLNRQSSGDFDRLETLLKNLPGMAYRCLNLRHWPMDFVSDGCFDLCGYERHEIESQQVLWGDFTHPDMVDEVDRKVRIAADKGEPFEVEYRIITRKGGCSIVYGKSTIDRQDTFIYAWGMVITIINKVSKSTSRREYE